MFHLLESSKEQPEMKEMVFQGVLQVKCSSLPIHGEGHGQY